MSRFRPLVAAVVVAAMALSACGQQRSARPPEPQFVSGSRAEPRADDLGTTGSVAADGEMVAITPDQVIEVDSLVVTDDAGNTVPNTDGWKAFDGAMAGRLIPADASAAVAVMIDGKVVHRGAYGERVPGEAAELGDRFRIASISKTITAIVTMQLVEDGTLALDEPVGQRLIEGLGVADPNPGAVDITVRELLSHTSGFPQHEGTFFNTGSGAPSCGAAAMTGLSSGIGGGGYEYSNMNYCVLGLLIEMVTGKTYERVVDERLLTPLGISGMRFTSTYEVGPDEVSHSPRPGRTFMEALGAAGAWNATPGDLVTIIDSVDPSTPGWKALSDDGMRAMRYRVPNDGPPSGYGLGVINYGGDTWGHTGTLENTHAMILVQPDGVTWAVTVAGEYPGESGNLRGIIGDALTDAFG